MSRLPYGPKRRLQRRWLCASLLLLGWMLVACPSVRAGEGLLGDIRREVRIADSFSSSAPDVPRPAESKKLYWSNPELEDQSKSSLQEEASRDFWSTVFFGAAFFAATPVWGPRILIGDEWNDGFYPRYPYEEGIPGYFMLEPDIPVDGYRWSSRLRGEYVGNDDDLSSVAGHYLLEFTHRFGADADVNYRREQVGGGNDDLWTGDTNLMFRFAQSEHWQFRIGAGVNWLAEPGETDYGYNLTYQADWFPHPPWITSFEMDWGEIGHAHLLHLRGTLGWQFRGVELYTGYDYYDLGKSHLQGMIGGVRFWF